MKIRITRNVAIEGEHCEAGSTREVNASTASQLIAIRAAVPVTEIETAEAPMKARETATIPTKKKSK